MNSFALDNSAHGFHKSFGRRPAGALLIGRMMSAYRAWYQVHRLELVSEASMHSGSVISTKVVSYARTTVTIRLELIQEGLARDLMRFEVAGNEWPFWNPRTRTVTRKFHRCA
jgi:hypothetical protein